MLVQTGQDLNSPATAAQADGRKTTVSSAVPEKAPPRPRPWTHLDPAFSGAIARIRGVFGPEAIPVLRDERSVWASKTKRATQLPPCEELPELPTAVAGSQVVPPCGADSSAFRT